MIFLKEVFTASFFVFWPVTFYLAVRHGLNRFQDKLRDHAGKSIHPFLKPIM